MGTLKSIIIVPAPVAKRISQIFEPIISPTAIPSDLRRNAVKSAESSGKLVPTPTIRIPTTFLGILPSSAKIIDEDFEIKITEFFNSPCPEGSQCVWEGVGIAFEYYQGREVETGIDLVQAFGYETTIIHSDYETYARLSISKIE